MSKSSTRQTEVICQTIIDRLRSINPHPSTELIYHSPFQLLIAVMLSAQTTDQKVNEVTSKLFAVAPTPETLLALGETQLKEHLRPINYYITKTKHVLTTCELLITQFHSQVPNSRQALESLPGVGRKTANVILNIIFHEPTLAVDTHIFRVAHRLGLTNGKTPLDVEQALLALIHPTDLAYAHHWLILHGRYTCIARKPKCHQCPVADLCAYPLKDI